MVTTYAIIEEGVVVNVALADGAWPFGDHAVPCPLNVGIGHLYADGVFTQPDGAPVPPIDPHPGLNVL